PGAHVRSSTPPRFPRYPRLLPLFRPLPPSRHTPGGHRQRGSHVPGHPHLGDRVHPAEGVGGGGGPCLVCKEGAGPMWPRFTVFSCCFPWPSWAPLSLPCFPA